MLLVIADTAQTSTGASLLGYLPLVLIAVFVYFVMIRPQRRRTHATQEMQRSLAVGDDVVTVGGLHGRVDAIGDGTVDLEVTEDIVVRFKRSAIAEVVRGDQPLPGDETEAAEPTE